MGKTIGQYRTPFSEIKNPTGKHKDWYRLDFVNIFCDEINKKKNVLNKKNFISSYKKQYLSLEMKERFKLIAELVDENMPGLTYEKKLKALENLFGKEWPNENGMFAYAYQLFPVSQFVEDRASLDIHQSLSLIHI